jgi:hypothetical protein
MEKEKIHWEFLVGVILVIGTILGVTIPLHMSLQNSTQNFMEGIRQDMNQFHREMREVSGRCHIVEERTKNNSNIKSP